MRHIAVVVRASQSAIGHVTSHLQHRTSQIHFSHVTFRIDHLHSRAFWEWSVGYRACGEAHSACHAVIQRRLLGSFKQFNINFEQSLSAAPSCLLSMTVQNNIFC